MASDTSRPDFTQLPSELKTSSRWVLWRLEDSVVAGKPERKRCKIPKTRTGRNASSTDPDTWCSLPEALEAVSHLKPAETYKDEPNNRGVGLVIGAPYFALDLDKCVNDDGTVDEWAKAIVRQIPPTYYELSPSGKGFHFWYRCDDHSKLPEEGVRTDKAEVYPKKRYFTMTGAMMPGSPSEVTRLDLSAAKAIFSLVEALKGNQPKSSDTPKGSSSAKIQEYLSKADFVDLSAAVQSLLTLLAIEYLFDKNQMEQVFLTSRLYKETHWKDKWDRLRDSELEKACGFAKENVAKRLSRKPTEEQLTYKLVVSCMEDVEEEVLEWLWEEKVPLGNVTIFAGNPGVGKSLMAMDLVGRGSAGQNFLDGKLNTVGSFKSVVLSVEDDKATIVKPRLKVINADMKMIQYVDTVMAYDEAGEPVGDRLISLEADLKLIADHVKNDPQIKLLVIDPLSNYMGNQNLFRDQEMRRILMPVVRFTQETKIAVIVIMHNSKQQGRDALTKIGAALGGVGAVRTAWSFMKKDEDSCLMLLAKANLGKFHGIEYTTEGVDLEIKGKLTNQARMKFLAESKANAETVILASEDQEERKEKPAITFLEKHLPKGVEVSADDLLEAAKALGISDSKLKRARGNLGIITSKKKDGWYWRWPDVPNSGPAHKESSFNDPGLDF